MPSSELHDVAVLGGGITGAAVAREASRRGFSVVLLEKGDFASGASSKSSKLIHGGQRYLESFHFGLVRESCLERAALGRLAPHLVRPLPFLFPIGEASAPPRPMLAAGLALYRALAAGTRTEPARFLAKERPEVAAEAPGLDPAGWTGAYRYFDAQADDVLLTLAFLRDAAAHGARLFSYTAVLRIARAPGGDVSGVETEDRRTGERAAFGARVVVSALGPWSNALSGLVGEELPDSVRPSRGSHFYLPAGVLPVRAAVVLLDRGGRRCYAIPWRGGTLLGTTDADDPVSPDAVAPTAGDRADLLDAARRFFPSANLDDASIAGGFAGLRPLLAATRDHSPDDASREESIAEPVPRLIVSVGGKLTTARKTAGRVVDRAERILDRDFGRRRPARPRESPLPGGAIADFEAFRADLRREAFRRLGLSEAQADRVVEREGADAPAAIDRMAREPDLARPISERLPYTVSDLVWGVERAGAKTVDDLLSRRVRLAWESPAEARAVAGRAEEILREAGAKPIPEPGV
ncbi:MAG TPA: glycerol-3-phosphate dehydrogenase/oxidase [Thermoanaerobaculia bacterium]|nr:glycerol-3-phosphate dehydrogenase/oxidase [Thermoanaerobaculia bacterium]